LEHFLKRSRIERLGIYVSNKFFLALFGKRFRIVAVDLKTVLLEF
jgi:hypothetical protein